MLITVTLTVLGCISLLQHQQHDCAACSCPWHNCLRFCPRIDVSHAQLCSLPCLSCCNANEVACASLRWLMPRLLPYRVPTHSRRCHMMATAKEKVWDYPRPPRLEPTSRHLIVKLGDTVVADTKQAYRVLETSHPPTYYLPPADCKEEYFTSSSKGQTFCEWKGRATYHDTAAGDCICRPQLGA